MILIFTYKRLNEIQLDGQTGILPDIFWFEIKY